MHHALHIQEILMNIFGHCYSPKEGRGTSDLPALARTCRAFKESALDVVWEELENLSPLAQCLPGASHQSSPDSYSYSRPLTPAEWDTLRSYTRRIRSIQNLSNGLDQKSYTILSDPPTIESIFPALRHLTVTYTAKVVVMPLMRLPFPSLMSISVVTNFEGAHTPQDFFRSFPGFPPNIRRFFLAAIRPDAVFGKFVSNCICQWQNLEIVFCPWITLDVNALVHLSRMPALTLLAISSTATFPASDSPILFSNLHHLALYSRSWRRISQLLSRIRLPSIANFFASVDSCPSKLRLSSFLASVQTSIVGHSIKSFTLDQYTSPMFTHRDNLFLDLEDLWPCMVYSSLCCIKLDIAWTVGLMDDDLLTLASAWPQLERLLINVDFGWNTSGGITPDGLLQLLQTCRSLNQVALAMDTRGYIEPPHSESLANLGLELSPTFHIDVLDSIIKAESVLAIITFFSAIASRSKFSLGAWSGTAMVFPPNWKVYKERWSDVDQHVFDPIGGITEELVAIQ